MLKIVFALSISTTVYAQVSPSLTSEEKVVVKQSQRLFQNARGQKKPSKNLQEKMQSGVGEDVSSTLKR